MTHLIQEPKDQLMSQFITLNVMKKTICIKTKKIIIQNHMTHRSLLNPVRAQGCPITVLCQKCIILVGKTENMYVTVTWQCPNADSMCRDKEPYIQCTVCSKSNRLKHLFRPTIQTTGYTIYLKREKNGHFKQKRKTAPCTKHRILKMIKPSKCISIAHM